MFYLGFSVMGAIKLLTLGGFGYWSASCICNYGKKKPGKLVRSLHVDAEEMTTVISMF